MLMNKDFRKKIISFCKVKPNTEINLFRKYFCFDNYKKVFEETKHSNK